MRVPEASCVKACLVQRSSVKGPWYWPLKGSFKGALERGFRAILGLIGIVLGFGVVQEVSYAPLVWALAFLRGLWTMGPSFEGGIYNGDIMAVLGAVLGNRKIFFGLWGPRAGKCALGWKVQYYG